MKSRAASRIRRQQRLFIEAFLGPRRRLFTLVVAVGIGGGLIGAAYVGTMHLLQDLLWPTHWATSTHLLIMVGVGATVGVLTKVLGNPGDVELLVNNIHVLGGAEDIRDLRSLVPVSLLCIAAGGGMGPEAPLVQTTGEFGSWVAGRVHLTREDTRVLTITGMAAAFTVLFGAPLGSAIFALEILHRRGLEYYEALLPAVLGSLSGYAVYVTLTHTGLQPVWHIPGSDSLRAADIGWAVVCGIGGALLAAIFTYMNIALRWVFRHLPPAGRPVAGGLALGLLAFWSPFALTFGEAQINGVAARNAVATVFIVAILAKLCGTVVTNTSGWRGGFIIPLFFIGVSAGRLLHMYVPSTNAAVLIAAFMAATNVGVTKTPLGSTLVVTEMAGLHMLPTTLIAAVVSLFLTSEVGLIHSQQEREGAFRSSPSRLLGLGDSDGLANPHPSERIDGNGQTESAKAARKGRAHKHAGKEHAGNEHASNEHAGKEDPRAEEHAG